MKYIVLLIVDTPSLDSRLQEHTDFFLTRPSGLVSLSYPTIPAPMNTIS